MEKLEQYRNYVQQAIAEYAQLGSTKDEIEQQLTWLEYRQLVHLSGCIYRQKNGCGGGNLISPQEHSSNADAAIHPSGSRSLPVLGLVAIGTDR